MTDAPRGPTTEAPPLRDALTPYRAVVGTRTWRGQTRAVYGTRYLARCRCGWSCGGDFIDAIRRARAHKRGCPA